MTKLEIVKLAKSTKDQNQVVAAIKESFPGYEGSTKWDTLKAFGTFALDRDTNKLFCKWLKL